MFVLRLFSHLPFSVLYTISDFLFFVSYRIIKYRRNVVWDNLRNSFPEKSEAELRVIEKQFYSNLCDYGVETLKLMTIGRERLSERMTWKNPELLQPFKNQNKSVILLASHQFNWEWLMVSGSVNLPVSIDFIYQKQSSKLFDQFITSCRTRFGAFAIERQNTAREVVRRKEITRGIAIVADQFPRFEKRYWTTFLNQDTAFFQGAGQLASLTQYPVFFGHCKKVRRGYYEAILLPIASPPFEKGSEIVIDNYVKVTEKLIYQYPDNWLWSHARWKEKKPTS
jgi:Kdo2-lipid IVA lauroyltransferase/acyltransferase